MLKDIAGCFTEKYSLLIIVIIQQEKLITSNDKDSIATELIV